MGRNHQWCDKHGTQTLKVATVSGSRMQRTGLPWNTNGVPETAHLAGSNVICIFVLKYELTSWEKQTKLKCGAGAEKAPNNNYRSSQ